MAKRKTKKLFDVEFEQEVISSVVNHYIEGIKPEELNEKTVLSAVEYGVEMTIGRIMHEATPRIAETLKNEFPGYRITVELIDDVLENPLDIEDTEAGLIINTKIKQKVDF